MNIEEVKKLAELGEAMLELVRASGLLRKKRRHPRKAKARRPKAKRATRETPRRHRRKADAIAFNSHAERAEGGA